MPRQDYQYDVFISYRHLPADMAAAKRLQKLLERHKRSDGKRLRVFRDQSELPTSSDLSADIQRALEQSRYLVVICSPDYLQSQWCMKELRHFRRLHGNSNRHILSLLVSGEPREVFPRELCWEERVVTGEDGQTRTVAIEVEPLCANISADSTLKRRWLLQTEYLRIAAPVLGVSFDTLYKRAQRRKWAMAAVAAAAVLAFGVYNYSMLSQIRQRQQQMYESQSLRLADAALPLAAQDPELAILLADAALPGDLQKPEYAILPEAELALRSAVLQRTVETRSNPFVIRSRIPLSASHWELGSFFQDGKWVALSDNSTTRLYDTHTGELLSTVNQPILLSQNVTSGVYFVAEGKRYVSAEVIWNHTGDTDFHYEFYDTLSGQLLGSLDLRSEPSEDNFTDTYFPLYDPVQQRCHVIRQSRDASDGYKRIYSSVGWFDLSGEFTACEDASDAIARLVEEDEAFAGVTASFSPQMGLSLPYEYGYWDLEDAPEDYRAVMAAFYEGYAGQWEIRAISRSADGQLYVMHVADPNKVYYDLQTTLEGEATAFWYAPENRLLTLWDDCCVYLPELETVVRVTESELVVYSVNAALYDAPLMQEDHYEYISPDGTWVLDLESQDYRDYVDFGPMSLYLTSDLSVPILETEVNALSVSADGSHVLYSDTQAGKLRLYRVAEQRVVYESDAAYYSICVNHDGSLVAWGQREIQVADTATGEILRSYTLDFPGAITGATHLEFSGERLLVLQDYGAYLCDLSSDAEPVYLPCGASSSGMYAGFLGDVCFTGDGLVLLPSDGIMVMGNPTVVTAIYDLNTLQEVSFFSTYSNYGQDFLYDDATGTLIVQLANVFYAQRRDENGDFQVVYTVTPQGSDMQMCTFEASADGKYLVLNSPAQCEIYDITDGSLVYLLKNEGFAMGHYGVIDGVLYDLRAGQTGAIRSYPLPDTARARLQAAELLTHGGETRSLTARESARYYIPEEWQ